jgi:hypothetical protein
MLVSVATLQKYCDPFVEYVWDWDTKPMSRLAVKRCVNANRVTSEPYEPPLVWRMNKPFRSRDWHNRRVAYLVLYPVPSPIVIDLQTYEYAKMAGLPAWMVQDGNHRLAAAIYRGDKYIEAEILGRVADARKLLGPLKHSQKCNRMAA